MLVYNEPCEATENEDGSPRSFVWRGREYTVVELVEEWRSMRPWWIDPLAEPMDHEVRLPGPRVVQQGAGRRRDRAPLRGLGRRRHPGLTGKHEPELCQQVPVTVCLLRRGF
ncbi:DUF6504 family protein [Planotetraspora kaengkrachanensis]|uniref:DUF6504 domain-containing protein n=1 Tax=Planotetraspora kaengkrachanensis TaxID=575193 RepID=A0A8J3LXE0_9ACTN|nr:hypothetical protein Pka01_27310 [Planotetraspora kaengkrachanensis]